REHTGTGRSPSMPRAELSLNDVTMMEAVHALRERRVYLQFEREPLAEANTDRSRPIVDSKRRFSVTVDVGGSPEQVVAALVHADGAYDWIRLTTGPDSFF